MPPKIRAVLTLIVIITATALWLGRLQIGLAASPVLYFGLTLGICGAIWMFPEAKQGDG